MTNQVIIGALFQEGTSQVRTPYFNGQHFSHWIARMEIYAKSYDVKVWRVIKKENYPLLAAAQPLTDPEDIDSYTNKQMAVVQVNNKARNFLYNVISGEEYEKISSCDTAKEMWDKLEVTYEETSKVKETHINMLVYDYELFQMKEGEYIEEIFARFSKIISDLKVFGKLYSSGDQVRKILRNLPTTCLRKDTSQENKPTGKAEKVAFKATIEIAENDINDDPEALQEEIAMMSRNMDGLMRRFRNTRRGRIPPKRPRQYNEQDKNDGKCNECGRFGHIQVDCPYLKRKISRGFNKNKSFGSWSDEDNSEHEEVANCFMTILENDMNKLSGCWIDEDISDDECKDNNKKLLHGSRKLGHASMHLIEKLSKHELVIDLPKLNFSRNHICDACQFGKQTRNSFKNKDIVSTSKHLQLLHMDLFGPTRTTSIGGKRYVFVIVDDYSHFTWVIFLSHKDEALRNFEVFNKKVEREKGYLITTIQSDHGGEFKSRAEGASTSCRILNRYLIRPILKKTPYELQKGKRPNISYFHPFGSKCFIHNNSKENLGKFDPRSDGGIFLGYSLNSRSFRVYNKCTICVEESVHIIFDENNSSIEKGIIASDEDQIQENQETSKSQKPTDGSGVVIESTNETNNNPPEPLKESTAHTVRPNEWRSESEYPQIFIIGDPNEGMKTRRAIKKKENIALISQIELKKIEEALKDSSWMQAMNDELDQFDKNQSMGFKGNSTLVIQLLEELAITVNQN
ncbi:uncharacterized protein LOC142176293 [Nicotiana tabacum]|uniref:Uncharacterized protein LOC142176293 n=1 Tax=Nicotiana tabacum TaxID=4097 RepID=A0AC58TQN2_TOBAC